MASYSNHPQHNVFSSPETPRHPSNGYKVREEAYPSNSDTGTAVLLSRKFDALAGGSMSNDSVHERMPQDPDVIGFSFVAEQKMTLPVEPVVTKTRKRRIKSIDSSNKAPRRRSLRIRRRQSLCAQEGREMPPSVENDLEDNNTAGVNGGQDKQVVGECQVKVTHDGSLALAQTLAEVVIDLVGSVSSEDKDEPTDTIITNPVDCESSGRNTTRHREKANIKSVLESLEPVEKENSLNCDKVVKLSSSSRKKRRDTFDLSKRRGLTRSGVVQSSDDGMDQNRTYAESTSLELQIDTDEVADLKPPAAIISAADQANETWTDMITPKNGSNEVQLPNTFSNEISSSSADDPDEIRGSSTVKEKLRNLSSVAIEEEMKSKFSEFSVYNYPCVSARIFAVMSIVYEDKSEFDPLLPFLQSLINAEMVSLKSRTQSNEVYFINRKVCFSGFDYSATMPARDDIDGSHVDLNSSIAALEDVLRKAQFPRSAYYLDVAIQCLHEMSNCDDVSEACSKTIVGYFPSSRLAKAIQHYIVELKDIKRHLSSMPVVVDFDTGVRYRLGDFVGRSIRFNLRKLLNTIPDNVLDFSVVSCEERWGRAVDDWAISSIFNFALEKIYELMSVNEQLFVEGASPPSFFDSQTSEDVVSMTRKQIRTMPDKMYEELTYDIKEARSFLLGIRACRFVWELLAREGVDDHVNSLEGWHPIESVARIFYELNIHECSENKHFVLLRDINELLEIAGGPILNLEVEKTEVYIQKLRKKLQPRKRESSFMVKGSQVYNLRMHLEAEAQEHFPQCLTPPKPKVN